MPSNVPILAQTGIGDIPEVILLLILAIWPFHLYCALTGNTNLQLVGHGLAAAVFQAAGLILVAIAAPFILRSQKRDLFVRILFVFLLYAATILGTNLLPGLF